MICPNCGDVPMYDDWLGYDPVHGDVVECICGKCSDELWITSHDGFRTYMEWTMKPPPTVGQDDLHDHTPETIDDIIF